MSVKFKINKLGPITNSEFEFKPFMIFSGDSSLGKSYSAFLTYYLTNLITGTSISTFEDFANEKLDLVKILEKINTEEVVNFNIPTKDLSRKINFNASQFLGYLIGDNTFEAKVEIILPISDFNIEISKENPISETSEDILLKQNKIKVRINNGRVLSIRDSALDNIAFLISLLIQKFLSETILKKNFLFQNIFLPPSRAALVGATHTAAEKITTSAGMYKEFLKDMERILEPVPEKFHPDKSIISLFEEILGGKILNEKGNLYYEFNDEKIPITAAASSIRELAPLFLLLNKSKPEEFSVLFEEPEAHTHPTLQIKVADMLCKLVNMGAYFQVTTHSDYFLNQINNSINLFNLKSKLKDGFKDFCKENGLDESKILDPKKLGAYYFKRREDGSVEIITQDATSGVPFDTFEKSVNTIMRDSAIIENQLEELLD